MYKIVRMYFKGHPKRTIKSGLTLEEAQAHCGDPETSSSTCTSAAGKARTRKMGPWFDGYEEEKPKRRSGRRWPKGAVWLGDPDFAPRGARTR
jgi:hypothetical protein